MSFLSSIFHPQRRWREHKQQPQGIWRNVNNLLTAVVFVIGVSIVIYLSVQGKTTLTEIIFRGMQFVLMMLLLQAPSVLRLRYRIEVPIHPLFCYLPSLPSFWATDWTFMVALHGGTNCYTPNPAFCSPWSPCGLFISSWRKTISISTSIAIS